MDLNMPKMSFLKPPHPVANGVSIMEIHVGQFT